MPSSPGRSLPFLFLIFAGALAGCGGGSNSDPAAAGRAAFAGYGCGTCHRVDGSGGVLGPDLTYVGFRQTPEWLDTWLKDPHGWKKNTLMPNFFLKEPVRKQLVAYLSTLKGNAYRKDPPWDREEFRSDPVKRGREIYLRVGCAGCHGPDAKGGFPNNNVPGGLIPALTKAAEGYTKEELRRKIKLGSHPQKDKSGLPGPMISMPAWGQVLKDDEIDALVEYLYSLKPADSGESW